MRARKQLRALDEEFRSFVEKQPYGLRAEFYPHSGKNTGDYCYFVVKPSLTPWDWAITIGEVVHNLRSALDHAIYAAAKRPNRRTQFPIFQRRCDWKEKVEPMISSVPDEVVSVIEQVQPYHAPEPMTHRLAILSYLSNRDKHRLLNTSILTLEGMAPGFQMTRGVSAIHSVAVSGGPLKDGHKIAHLVIGFDEPDPEVELYGEFAHSVAFDDSSARGRAINGIPVMDIMASMPRLIQDIIVRIEVICEPKPSRDVRPAHDGDRHTPPGHRPTP